MIAVEGVKLLTRRSFKAWNQLQTNNFRVLLTARTLDWVTYVTGMPTLQRPPNMSLPLVTKFPRGSSKGLITRSGETRMNSERCQNLMATSRGCRRRTLLDAGPIQNGMDPPHQDLTAEYAAL